MCAQYMIKARIKLWKKVYGIDTEDLFEIEGFDEHRIAPKPLTLFRDENSIQGEDEFRIAPNLPGLVIVPAKEGRELRAMNFSLIPSWSKEPKVKFATYNARLESTDTKGDVTYIFQKPTWKGAFERRHCLVPIDKFIEPAYHGKLAGNMVAFSPTNNEPMTAAGIWETWVNHSTGEIIESFTILTDDPIPFVENSSGHDRSPIFLRPDAFEEWLNGKKSGLEWIEFLRTHRADYELMIDVDRAMKPGWEKRR